MITPALLTFWGFVLGAVGLAFDVARQKKTALCFGVVSMFFLVIGILGILIDAIYYGPLR